MVCARQSSDLYGLLKPVTAYDTDQSPWRELLQISQLHEF
jgi:hypothetical protein